MWQLFFADRFSEYILWNWQSNNIMIEKQVLLLVQWPQKTSHFQNDTENKKQYTTNFTPTPV